MKRYSFAKSRAFSFAVVLTALALVMGGQATGAERLDRIVAVVEQEVVLASELEEELQQVRHQLFQQGQQMPDIEELREHVLERLIMHRLQLSRAQRLGIQVDNATLDAAVQQIAAENNMTLPQLRDALAQEGMDFERFREDIREEIAVTRLRQSRVDARVDVSPREIDEALEAARDDDDREYRVAHIRVATPEAASSQELAEAQERAETLHRRINEEDADFAALADAFSDDPSADEGGDLGWRAEGQLPSGFRDTVTGMEPGEVSSVVQTSDGFHIIKLLDKRFADAEEAEETRARHVLIRTGDGVEDEDARQRLEGFLDRIEEGESFEHFARNHSDDPGSSGEGGDLGWVSPEQLVPQFAEVMERLEPGEISEPFQTQYGWHIVEVLDRRVRDVTEERRRERIAEQIHERKRQETLQQWLRELRDSAYVDYRLEES